MSAPKTDPRFKDEARDLLEDVRFEDKWHEDECVSIVSEILDESATLRALYAEAVRAADRMSKLAEARAQLLGCYRIGRRPSGKLHGHLQTYANATEMCAAVLSRPEAQEVLRG